MQIDLGNVVGPQGEVGVGVPEGGTTGQVLRKVSATDFDAEWGDLTESASGVEAGVYGVQAAGNTIWVPTGGNNTKITLTAKRYMQVAFDAFLPPTTKVSVNVTSPGGMWFSQNQSTDPMISNFSFTVNQNGEISLQGGAYLLNFTVDGATVTAENIEDHFTVTNVTASFELRPLIVIPEITVNEYGKVTEANEKYLVLD